MSETVDQPETQQNVTPARGLDKAVISLNREFRAVLANEEAAEIGRAVAQIVRGDGWKEAKSSAVLVAAIVRWLGPDAVYPVGFFANGTGPVEVLAKVGNYFLTGYGIEVEDNLIVACCERHRGARFTQSRLEEMDLARPNQRFTEGPMAQRAADRLGDIFSEEIDAEIARVVLGAEGPQRLR
jgi:hypothetical protein